jgi:hypothetical protein
MLHRQISCRGEQVRSQRSSFGIEAVGATNQTQKAIMCNVFGRFNRAKQPVSKTKHWQPVPFI